MISKDKQYRTRDGREVRIYATDGVRGFEVHGAIKEEYGWVPMNWQEDGCHINYPNCPSDLIEVKPRIKREYWVNVYEEDDIVSILHRSKENAEKYWQTELTRLACVKVVIDCEEGEGL